MSFSNGQLVSTSKFLSLVLRHAPETIGISLDSQGWVEVNRLVDAARQHGKAISLALVHEVVATSDKQRFALSEDGLMIRANQGHSLKSVELALDSIVPPETLFHGTVSEFLKSIRLQGLTKRSRNHVHLSADEETAMKVGARRGKPVVLIISAFKMHEAGYVFFRSANGVWLTDHVPPEFIQSGLDLG